LKKILIATKNPDKFREIHHLLAELSYDFVSLIDFPDIEGAEETGLTLLENSTIKALDAYRKTGIPAVADDTGLSVFALQGMPGVFSARFAGKNATYRDNRLKLLNLMDGVTDRRASFVTVVTFVIDESRIFHFIGEVEGFITTEERGNMGFGYDSIFLYPQLGKTFAEIPLEHKNKISHRARAFSLFRRFLMTYESNFPG